MPTILLRPSEIRFAQKSISGEFQDGRRLDETFAQLLRETLTPDKLPPIDVVYKDGHWWTVTGNRRLYLYRKLELLQLVNCIKVNQKSMEDYGVRGHLNKLMTTVNCGKSVCIRRSYSSIGAEIDRLEREWIRSKAKQTVVVNVYDTSISSHVIPNVASHIRNSSQTIPNVVNQTGGYIARNSSQVNHNVASQTVEDIARNSSKTNPNVVSHTRNSSQAIPDVVSQTVGYNTRNSSHTIPNGVSQTGGYITRNCSQSIPNVVSQTGGYITRISSQAISTVVNQTGGYVTRNSSQVKPNVVSYARDSSQAISNVVSYARNSSQGIPHVVSHPGEYITRTSSQSVSSGMSQSGHHASRISSYSGEHATRNSTDSVSLTTNRDRDFPVAPSVVEIEIENPDEIPAELGYLSSIFRVVFRFVTRLFRSEGRVS